MGDRRVTLVPAAAQQDMVPFSEITSGCARTPGSRWGLLCVTGHNQNTGARRCRELPAHPENPNSKGANKMDFFIFL